MEAISPDRLSKLHDFVVCNTFLL